MAYLRTWYFRPCGVSNTLTYSGTRAMGQEPRKFGAVESGFCSDTPGTAAGAMNGVVAVLNHLALPEIDGRGVFSFACRRRRGGSAVWRSLRPKCSGLWPNPTCANAVGARIEPL